MTIDWNYTQSKTTIEHLTVRYRGAAETMNAATLRTYIERLLDTVDLQPTGLSSGAVLIVRKIQELVPLPTTALARFTQPERERWLEQVRRQMATLYATATRPMQQPDVSSANAILFADPAEMLACLTRDILNGQAWQHWYWQRVLSTVPHFPSTALTSLWSTQATFLPAALTALHPGEAYKAITLLSLEELWHVTQSLYTSFGLPTVMLPNERDYRMSQSVSTSFENEIPTSSPSSMTSDDSKTNNRGEPRIAPPWQQWLSDAPHINVSPEAHYLLGLGLTLYHAPSLAKSTSFACQTTAWLQNYKSTAQNAVPKEHDTSIPTPVSSPDIHDIYTVYTDTGRVTPSQFKSAEAITDETSLQPTVAALPEIPLAKEQLHIEEGSAITSSPYIASEQGQSPPIQDGMLTQVSTHPFAAHDTRAFEVGTAKPLPTEGITTQLGGILYLINLLPLLKSRIAEHILAQYTSGWGLIEAMAKGLLGTLYARYEDDSMWDVLASLDGRRDRCITSSPTSTTDEDEMRPVGTDVSRPRRLSIGDEDVIHRSLQGTDIINVYRLLAGLLHEPDVDMAQIAEMVLCKYGRVVVSRTHVDLYMSMEEIILPVRRAGLDRDPGWVPELARIVLFHFD